MKLGSLMWWRKARERRPAPVTAPAVTRKRVTAIGGFGRMRCKSCTTCREEWMLHHRCGGWWVCCDD